MNILISNDDGITSPGLHTLAEIASAFGTVWVSAPAQQCSAMSQRLTIFMPVHVTKAEVPCAETAWSVEGTPADCVKLGIRHLMPVKPDLVLSGINRGFNSGFDIPYSGTIGAAMEALMNGIPAIAVSTDSEAGLPTVRAVLPDILKKIIGTDPGEGCIYNVNIPVLPPEEIKGVLYGVKPAPYGLYKENYICETLPDGSLSFTERGSLLPIEESYGDNDSAHLAHGYITVGPVRNMSL